GPNQLAKVSAAFAHPTPVERSVAQDVASHPELTPWVGQRAAAPLVDAVLLYRFAGLVPFCISVPLWAAFSAILRVAYRLAGVLPFCMSVPGVPAFGWTCGFGYRFAGWLPAWVRVPCAAGMACCVAA